MQAVCPWSQGTLYGDQIASIKFSLAERLRHFGLGTWYLQKGQRQQAYATLMTAITLYRAMDMTFWLPQAEASLAQVERSREGS